MCCWCWNASHTANHHNHRGCQHNGEAQAEEKQRRKTHKITQKSFCTTFDWIGYQFENHLGVILLILDPIVSITRLPQQTIPVRNWSKSFFSLSEIDHKVFLVGERKFEPSEMPRPPQRRIPYRGWFVEYPTGCLFTTVWSYFENILRIFCKYFLNILRNN